MSILNDTLKSLDERNQSEDFGLPPTVHVASRPLWPKILIALLALGLIGWLVFSANENSYHNSEVVVAEQTKDFEQSDTQDNETRALKEPPKLTSTANENAEVQSGINDSETLEGMQAIPLSEQDMAYQNVSSDVALLAFNSVDETIADDEAEYRLRAQDANAPNPRSNTEIEAVENAASSSASIQTRTVEAKNIESKVARSVEVAPKSPQQQSATHLEAGLKAYNFGIFDEAQKSFTLALSAYPQNQDARKQLAALYFGQNNNLQALQVLSEGVVLSPESLVWRELMAKILVQESRFEEALNLMPDSLDAKALAQERIDYLILKGTSAQTINKPEQAISAFSAMTSLQPNNAKWWLALGVNYDALADKRLAISSYSRALAIGGLSSTSSQYASSRLTDLQEQP